MYLASMHDKQMWYCTGEIPFTMKDYYRIIPLRVLVIFVLKMKLSLASGVSFLNKEHSKHLLTL